MSVAQLRSNVNQLTNSHKVSYKDTHGVQTYQTSPSMLELLRIAQTQDSNGGGSGGGRTASAPVAINAFSLMQDIRKALAVQHASIWGLDDTQLKVDAKLTKITDYAASSSDNDAIDQMASITSHWIADIHQLLSPVRKAPLPGKCPVLHCSLDRVVTKRDGETIITPALWFYGAEVICHGCGTTWVGLKQITELRDSMEEVAA